MELVPDFMNDFRGSLTDRDHREGSEEVGQHRAEQSAAQHISVGQRELVLLEAGLLAEPA